MKYQFELPNEKIKYCYYCPCFRNSRGQRCLIERRKGRINVDPETKKPDDCPLQEVDNED